MPSELLPLVIVTLLALAVGIQVWHFRRSREILANWVRENGFTLIDSKRLLFRRGPFFWTSGNGQDVYHVVVLDRDGRTKAGYVRCGSYLLGVLADEVTVHWDR